VKEHLTYIQQDWATAPFIDMIVVKLAENDQKSCPQSHPDEVLYQVWPGIKRFCDCTSIDDGSKAALGSTLKVKLAQHYRAAGSEKFPEGECPKYTSCRGTGKSKSCSISDWPGCY